MNHNAQAKKYLYDRDYKMKIVLDQGVHRHLEFKHNNRSDGHFNITTWPGHLCISGDMGTFVFRRIEDMIYFFNGEGINPGYWSEKVQAGASISGAVREFDFDVFQKDIKERLSEYLDEDEYEEKTIEEAKKAIEQLEWVKGDEYGAITFIRELSSDLIEICDLPDHKVWTFHYLFACYAINYACNTYLAEKQDNPNEQVIYEVIDTSNDEMYYPLAIFTSFDDAKQAIEDVGDEKISEYAEDYEEIQIIERFVGWNNVRKKVFVQNRDIFYNEELDEERCRPVSDEDSEEYDCTECSGTGSVCSNSGLTDEEETCEACQGSGAMPGSKAYEEHCYGDR